MMVGCWDDETLVSTENKSSYTAFECQALTIWTSGRKMGVALLCIFP